MYALEQQIFNAVSAGERVNLSVIPVYQGNNLIPLGVTIRGEGSNGLYIYQTVLNRVTNGSVPISRR